MKMVKSTYRGHEIYEISGAWFYLDNNMPVAGTIRKCGHCGKESTKEGHDACIGHLNGVMNACCGHGRDNSAYIQFLDGKIINGIKAKALLSDIKALKE